MKNIMMNERVDQIFKCISVCAGESDYLTLWVEDFPLNGELINGYAEILYDPEQEQFLPKISFANVEYIEPEEEEDDVEERQGEFEDLDKDEELYQVIVTYLRHHYPDEVKLLD